MTAILSDWLWRLEQVTAQLPALIPYRNLRYMFIIASWAPDEKPDHRLKQGDQESKKLIDSFPRGKVVVTKKDFVDGIAGFRWTKKGLLRSVFEHRWGTNLVLPFATILYVPDGTDWFPVHPLTVADATLSSLICESPAEVRELHPWLEAATGWHNVIAYFHIFQAHPMLTANEGIVDSQATFPIDKWLLAQFVPPLMFVRFDHNYQTVVKCVLEALHQVGENVRGRQLTGDERRGEATGQAAPETADVAAGQQAGRPATLDDIADGALLSAARLAEIARVPYGALRKRLERYRKTDHGCFAEQADRGTRQPNYLYYVGRVRHIVEALAPSSATSSKRPPQG